MKKNISLLLVLLFTVLSFTACKGGETPSEPGADPSSTEIPSQTAPVTESVPAGFEDLIKNSTVTPDGAYLLTEGIYITEIFSFTGEFVEDGSFENKTGILACRILNTTSSHYQLIDFTLNIGGADYSFNCTTLFAGSELTLLERNGSAYPSDLTLSSSAVNTVAEFNETPSVHLDLFEITYTDGIINVKNITDRDYENVYVYYKPVNENGDFIGGITFRVNAGTVPAGKIVQCRAARFNQNGSKIVFVTFLEDETEAG